MKPWDNGRLKVSKNKRYFVNGESPFFWLGDTAWLIFTNISEKEAEIYIKNRAAKGLNVIQAVLVYATKDMTDINKMPVKNCDITEGKYWEYCDKIIYKAEKEGMYMALLPSWGSLVKQGIINCENAGRYAEFLAERYGKRKNIIWLLGGDIKAEGYEDVYNIMGSVLKEKAPDQLIGFHPFGRCSSTMWFANAKWLDFNMFQSGHRRYDQSELGAWDDNGKNREYYGEDNWKYVKHDLNISHKPVLDGEPSYERILQGLHDDTQPYWTAKDVRRYAYWSVFEGACGHTYGDNSIMQFYDRTYDGVTYGAKDCWVDALHHDGSGQMGYMKRLMESVDFVNGSKRNELLIDGQKEKYERVAVFGGSDFVMAYNYSGRRFRLYVSEYIGKDIWYFKPATGVMSYAGKIEAGEYEFVPFENYDDNSDIVVVIK